MRALILSLALLAGCQGQASPEQQFLIAQNSGSTADACAATRRAADAALANGNQAQFERWKTSRDIYCSTANIPTQ